MSAASIADAYHSHNLFPYLLLQCIAIILLMVRSATTSVLTPTVTPLPVSWIPMKLCSQIAFVRLATVAVTLVSASRLATLRIVCRRAMLGARRRVVPAAAKTPEVGT